ncbi:MAG: phospholipid carrier-dependent glycosyltransferase [Blastocatellia bacterium]
MSNNAGPGGPDRQIGLNHLVALGLLSFFLLIFGTWKLPLIGPDEPRYAEIGRVMALTGDWITPRLGGIDWFEKPALTYWLVAGGFKLFGESEFTARIGIGLTGMLGVLLLYFAGTRFRSARFGYLSAAVLVSSGMWIGFSRVATFDLPLAVAIELAMIAWLLWDRAETRRARVVYWSLFGLALGLAMLAKGLVGILFPVIIVGVHSILTGKLKRLLDPARILAAGAIFLATSSLWYGPMIARHGRLFIDEFFIAHHFQRYLTNQYRHPQPFWFFVFVAVAGCFPWIYPLLVRAGGLRNRWRSLLADETDRFELFTWLWALIPIIFFSFSGSKLPGYILPVFPPLAMIIARQLEDWWDEERPSRAHIVSVTLTMATIFLAAVMIALRGSQLLGLDKFSAFRLAAMGVLVAFAYQIIWFLLHIRAATRFLPFGFAVVLIAVINIVSPVLAERETLKPLGELATRLALPGERMVFYINSNHRINYYATQLPLRDSKSYFVTAMSPAEILPLIDRYGGESILVLSQREWTASLLREPALRLEILGEQRGPVKCAPRCDMILIRARSVKQEQ